MVNPDRPAVQLKYVDAGPLHLTWRWEHAPEEPRIAGLPRAMVRGPLDALARALPSPLPGETTEQALDRSLRGGPLLDPAREQALAEDLARVLFPAPLAAELNELLGRGVRPHLRIQPSPSTARVPWEALRLSAAERLVHVCDVSLLPPATVRNARGRRVSPWRPDGPVVGVLDPRVPGFADASPLGSVLGPVGAGSALAALADALGPRLVPAGPTAFRRDDLDRDTVERALADATRLLYVGHVTAADHGLGTRLHLCCGTGTAGRASPVGAHRPLTAADIALGHRPDRPRPWRLPNRVALVACESGGDARFAEPSGLVAAMVHGGAEYVTATRWVLPTDAGLAALVPGLAAGATPFADAVVAVNAAHESAAPVPELAAWQEERARRWDRSGDPADSPVLWGGFSTAWAPAPKL